MHTQKLVDVAPNQMRASFVGIFHFAQALFEWCTEHELSTSWTLVADFWPNVWDWNGIGIGLDWVLCSSVYSSTVSDAYGTGHTNACQYDYGLNPLEFRHLFGIYNVDSFHRMGVQICAHCTHTHTTLEREIVVSSFACFSHPTAFNGNGSNCYIRQLPMQALSHSGLLFWAL